jgi:transcriptional regulator with XRE-family HTH domain
MAIGKRIKFFRNLRGFTQKQFGEMLGFMGKTSDVRMAQYEAEARVPKEDLVNQMAGFLNVSPNAIQVPDIDSYIGLMHTFFALEDMYGLKISNLDGELCLRLDKSTGMTYSSLFDMFYAWEQEAAKLQRGEITKEEYDQWRYNYPNFDTTQHWAKVPSKELSDALLDALNDEK